MSDTTILKVSSGPTTLLQRGSTSVLRVTQGPTIVKATQGIPGPAQGGVLTTLGDVLSHDGTGADRLPVGTDGQQLTADSGAGLGVSWQSPAVGSLTTVGDLLGYNGATARFPVGADDQILIADAGEAFGFRWAAQPVPSHASTHENGGSDEISVLGLSGLLADEQDPLDHAVDHQNGGVDEINVGGLSGLLADGQTPLSHGSTHENGGSDEISVLGLSGLLADAQTPLGHAATHLPSGSDPLTTAAASTIDADTSNAEGAAESFARSDHTHDITTAVVVDVGAANAEGASASLARADHVHSHGTLLGGALHAVATVALAGFMSAADKAKLDGLPSLSVFDIFVENAGVPDDLVVLRFAEAITLSELRFVIVGTGGPQVTVTIRYAASAAAIGTEVDPGGTVVTSTTTGDLATLTNPAIPAGSYIRVDVTATVGVIDQLQVHLEGALT